MISMLAGDAQMAGAALSWLGSALTTTFAACFAAWAFWAWRPRNRDLMEAYARIPFDNDTVTNPTPGVPTRGDA